MSDVSAITLDNTALSNGGAASGARVDHSYSRFDKGVQPTNDSQVMSFDDFLDMINPLQHVPLVSSIYRAVTGETINPISRIAGDALYGGVFGLASAGIAALGAVGDELVAANNGGKGISSTLMAAVFGSDDTSSDVQLASNVDGEDADPSAKVVGASDVPSLSAPPMSAVSPTYTSLQSPAVLSPILDMPHLAATTATQAAPEALASNASASLPVSVTNVASSQGASEVAAQAPSGKAIPIDRAKLAYGGVMDTSMVQNAQQNQTLAMAMAGQNNVMQAQRALRSNRFAGASSALPGVTGNTLPGATPATTPITSETTAAQIGANPQTQAAMQSLLKELQGNKGINQYRNAAQSSPVPGTTLNIAN